MNENASKLLTATVLCSLSAIALWSGIRGFSELGQQATTDADEDSSNDQQKPVSPKTTAISTPEKLTKPSAKPSSKSTSQAKPSPKVTVVTVDTSPLPIAPYWQRSQEALPTLPASNMVLQEAAIEQNRSATEPIFSTREQSLRDIEGHWAQYYIEFLITKRVVQGFPDGSFRPDRTITPTEFNSMTRRAFPSSSFGDKVPVSYRELQMAIAGRAATRADAAAYIYRAIIRTEPVPIVTSIQVNGEVSRPGAYSLAAMSNENLRQEDQLPTVSRAIQQAGGSLANANLQQVEIHRLTETGTKKVIKVDVAKTLEMGDRSLDPLLQQDDQIVIPAIIPTAQNSTSTDPDF
ncbi:periplasmic protein involved in polysaccharide export [Leptolyngbyaceae cyanobacterium JSC-12]|nr:periplasmic protein involved in polysaccharide export [Leptolyngbyaceae cyanobacterium JSC-12]